MCLCVLSWQAFFYHLYWCECCRVDVADVNEIKSCLRENTELTQNICKKKWAFFYINIFTMTVSGRPEAGVEGAGGSGWTGVLMYYHDWLLWQFGNRVALQCHIVFRTTSIYADDSFGVLFSQELWWSQKLNLWLLKAAGLTEVETRCCWGVKQVQE